MMKYWFVALALLLFAPIAFAAAYPDKPVRVIVPVPAGGTPDVVARMVMPPMSQVLGQQFVIDNRGGAGGMIAAELAAKAPPDGYTLFFSSPGALTILPHLQSKVPYDALSDFAPISLVSSGPFLLVIHPSVPAKSVRELIALARAEPGRLNYASAGSGSANHLAAEHFKSMARIDISHVPYRGSPQAITDVLGGHMNMIFNSVPPVIQHIKAGRLRTLGIASLKRSPQLPDVPTIDESGLPGYESVTWFGLFAPAKIPAPLVAQLHASLVRVVRMPEIRQQFELQGYDPVGSTPAEFGALVRSDFEKYGKVVRASGARVD